MAAVLCIAMNAIVTYRRMAHAEKIEIIKMIGERKIVNCVIIFGWLLL